MTRPRLFLTRMALFLIAVIAACVALFGPLRSAFMASPPLNGLILGVMLLGIFFNFRQVFASIRKSPGSKTSAEQPTLSQAKSPKLLAPMATMLGERRDRLSLPPWPCARCSMG